MAFSDRSSSASIICSIAIGNLCATLADAAYAAGMCGGCTDSGGVHNTLEGFAGMQFFEWKWTFARRHIRHCGTSTIVWVMGTTCISRDSVGIGINTDENSITSEPTIYYILYINSSRPRRLQRLAELLTVRVCRFVVSSLVVSS